jgi:hypothetical protein
VGLNHGFNGQHFTKLTNFIIFPKSCVNPNVRKETTIAADSFATLF